MLSCRLENTGLSRIANKQDAVSIDIPRDNLLSLLRLLGLVYGANLGILLLGEGACPDGAVPWDRSLADVALERGQVRRRVERHDDGVAAASSRIYERSDDGPREETEGVDGRRGFEWENG
jgi:hypothetical protein